MIFFFLSFFVLNVFFFFGCYSPDFLREKTCPESKKTRTRSSSNNNINSQFYKTKKAQSRQRRLIPRRPFNSFNYIKKLQFFPSKKSMGKYRQRFAAQTRNRATASMNLLGVISWATSPQSRIVGEAEAAARYMPTEPTRPSFHLRDVEGSWWEGVQWATGAWC